MTKPATESATKSARLIDLGTREFGEVWATQRELVSARQKDEIPDTLLFVEHPHVITAGRSAHKENLLATDGIPMFEIERGGDATLDTLVTYATALGIELAWVPVGRSSESVNAALSSSGAAGAARSTLLEELADLRDDES